MNPYEVLGLNPNCSDEEVKNRYRKLAQKYHPDVNPGNMAASELFLLYKRAYEEISGNTFESDLDFWGVILRDSVKTEKLMHNHILKVLEAEYPNYLGVNKIRDKGWKLIVEQEGKRTWPGFSWTYSDIARSLTEMVRNGEIEHVYHKGYRIWFNPPKFDE